MKVHRVAASRIARSFLLCLTLLGTAGLVHAGQPAYTPEPVTLPALVDAPGKLLVLSAGEERVLDVAALEAMGLHQVDLAGDFWQSEPVSYQGVLLRTVLEAAGIADVAQIRLTGMDGFSQLMPREDWRDWPVMIATRENGQPIAMADKGPLRIIYPYSMSAALQDPLYRLRWVWLLVRVEAVPD